MAVEIEKVPIHLKMTLSIREAAEYSNIGINKIDRMLRSPNCPFVLFVGTKKLVKRKEFEQFISSSGAGKHQTDISSCSFLAVSSSISLQRLSVIS